jgi:DNA-binding MarR family transcriptional regulator
MINSPFDLNHQRLSTDGKIVAVLERISEAFKVMLWDQSKVSGLSPIQIQMLIFLRFHSKKLGRVSYLAKEFNLTKATVSDSIKVLFRKELIEKVQDPMDSRSFTILLTPLGRVVAENSANFTDVIESPISNLKETEKEILLHSLLSITKDLQKRNVLVLQRMCLSCSYHSDEGQEHHCSLLNIQLSTTQLRVDCEDYKSLE